MLLEYPNKKNNYTVLLLVTASLIAFIIWYSPSTFVKDTFFNKGDTCFPLALGSYCRALFYTWFPPAANGFGHLNDFPVMLFPSSVCALLNSLGIPVWLANRLWLFVPTFLLGCAIIYLFNTIEIIKEYNYVGVLCSMLFVMSSHYCATTPLYSISLATLIFSFSLITRAIKSERFEVRYIILAALLSPFLLLYVRTLYMHVVLLLAYLALYVIIMEKKFLLRILLLLVIYAVLSAIMNSYAIIQIFYSLLWSHDSQFFRSSIVESRGSYADYSYATRQFAPYLTFRQLNTRGANLPMNYYLSTGIGAFFSFFPQMLIATLILKKKLSRYLLILIVLTQIMLLHFVTMWYFKTGLLLFKLLQKFIFGYSMGSHPAFWLAIYTIFIGMLLGISIQFLLIKIDNYNRNINNKVKYFAKAALISGVILFIIFVQGRNVITDYVPPSISNKQGNYIFGNHLPYAQIPNEYTDLKNYLKTNARDNEKLLSLPFISSYCNYTWWPYSEMPDILSSFSPIPVVGSIPTGPFFKNFEPYPGLNHNLKTILFQMSLANCRYVIVHKDYSRGGNYCFGGPEKDIIKSLSSKEFTPVMVNRHFVLFKFQDDR